MEELLKDYLVYCEKVLGRNPRIVAAYKSMMKTMMDYLREEYGREPTLADFTFENCQRYDAYRKKKGLAQNTRQTGSAHLRAFGRWLILKGHLTENPAEKLKVRVTEKPKQMCATDAEVIAMFDACKLTHREFRKHLCAGVLAMMAYCGLRRSDVCKLRLQDIHKDEEHPYVDVYKSKGNKWYRVPLPDEAIQYIDNWLEFRPATKLNVVFAVPVLRAHGECVVALTGERIEGVVKELLRLSGSKRTDLTPHAFRRFMATSLLRMPGASLKDVQDALGHEHLETTIKYIQSDTARLQKLMKSFSINAPVPPPPTVERILPTHAVVEVRESPKPTKSRRIVMRR